MAEKAEKLCGCHLSDSIRELESSVKNICNLLSPVINVAFTMQQKVGSVNLMEVESTPSGLWQSSICVNAKTSIYHVQDYCTYTLCKVPTQPNNNKSNLAYERMFIIQLSDTETISIKKILHSYSQVHL